MGGKKLKSPFKLLLLIKFFIVTCDATSDSVCRAHRWLFPHWFLSWESQRQVQAPHIFSQLFLNRAKCFLKYVCTSCIMLRAGCGALLPDHELYKKKRIPACVWNGIVHSLCHISACLTRQNKSFSIFQRTGADRVRRRGCCAALLPPPASSFPICCPALPSEVLSSPLRLHRPEKHRPKIPSTDRQSQQESTHSHLSPPFITSPSVPYHRLHSFSAHNPFLTLPPLGLNMWVKMQC